MENDALVSRHGQRLGDIAANTVVIVNPSVILPDSETIKPGKCNSFHEHPRIEARLRQNTPTEAMIVLRAVLRRKELNREARIRLFSEIPARPRAIAEFPAEADDGLSGEQYVRNAVDATFRARDPAND